MSATVDTPPQAGISAAEAERARQMRQAEELLFADGSRPSFAKALFAGDFRGDDLFPYPRLGPDREHAASQALEQVRTFLQESVDPAAIDREADIPRSVIDGLGRLGVLGMTAPAEYGGRGFNQQQYCRVMEAIGGHCSSTAVFVNAHHSIGIRALLLFGSPAQRARWLPGLVAGHKLAAFALTEENAGSDAGNVQTVATPTEDGQAYILNGSKRYITNAAIADVLTVMARTPAPGSGESKVTAFLVTPDLPGFEIVEGRMPKCGIRGTATARLAFHNMRVPAENVLGPLGKGLRVALTVLDFGRTTFGASCTGMAKTCLRLALDHAKRRRQFGRPLAEFELIRKKLARMAALSYAMEATTYQTAALIDSGAEDYMLETAILKVFATEALWEIVYETMQIYGGQGYFTDEPLERIMRDARINQIGEGANEVLKAFIAVVGMRDVGMNLMATAEALKDPRKTLGALWGFGAERARRIVATPRVPVKSPELQTDARELAARVKRFGWTVEQTLFAHRENPEAFLDRQLLQERITEACITLVTSACTLARLDDSHGQEAADRAAGLFYLRLARRRYDEAIASLKDNEDEALLRAAAALLKTEPGA